MDPLAAFIITLALITAVSLWYRISPFFTLIGGAILFGLLAGMTPDGTILGDHRRCRKGLFRVRHHHPLRRSHCKTPAGAAPDRRDRG